MCAGVIRDDLLVDAVLFIRKPVEAVHSLLIFFNQHGQFSVLQKKALEIIGAAFFIYTQITVFCTVGLSFKSKISMIQFCRIPSVSPVMININPVSYTHLRA